MPASEDLFDYLCEDISDVYWEPGKNYAKFAISGTVAVYSVRCWAKDSTAQVLITLPILVPEGARRDVAEALCGINYAVTIGSFELDFRDGEMRFVVSTFLEDDRLSRSVWQSMMGAAISTAERITPVICSMIYGNESPQEALATIGFYDEPAGP
jgi:hypothetical protein